MTRDADYWAARRAELLGQMESDEAALQAKLSKLYENQVVQLEREIAAYYQEYGEKNVIEYRKLMVSLSDKDKAMLIERMDEFDEKYPQYAHLMPVRESIYKLNELEGIQTSIRLQQLEIGAIEQSELDAHFRKQAQRAANLAAEELGFGSNFYGIDATVVTDTVGAAWAKGKAFSQTIWDNREKLAAYLNDDFAQLVARGVSYDKVAKSMGERFASVASNDIRRLIYTEGTFLFNEAQAQVHQTDFDYYALSCADSRACQICKDLQAEQHLNPARFEDRAPGINFPPMHPWCRCSYTVEVGDWEAWIDRYVEQRGGDRASIRDPYRKAKDDAGVVNLKLHLERDKSVFEDALATAKRNNKNGGSVDWHAASEMADWDTYLSDDMMVGVAVKEDADITCVFKNDKSKYRGAVTDLILMARERGGVKMDCYGKFLVNSYEKCGYEVVARVPFNAEYVDDPLLLLEQPDVYFLKKTSDSIDEVIRKIASKTYHQSTQAELDSLPTFDYDEAWKYRDNLLK